MSMELSIIAEREVILEMLADKDKVEQLICVIKDGLTGDTFGADICLRWGTSDNVPTCPLNVMPKEVAK